MTSNPIIEQHVIDTGTFQNVSPRILNSGEVGFYYLNAEKLARDDGAWNKYKNDSEAMYHHTVQMTKEHPEFNEVIDILTNKAQSFMDFLQPGKYISGGQTRDWIFSAPVANRLRVPHISIYKNGRVEAITPDLEKVSSDYYRLNGAEALHIVDLLTEGSSCYRVESDGKVTGWVPSLRDLGLKANHLLAVVDRMQGGIENLSNQGIKVHSFVEVDREFLEKYSEDPERDLAYALNPKSVVVPYLQKNGALAFVDDFNPEGDRLDKANRFVERYGDALRDADKYVELVCAVHDKYGESLGELMK